VFAGNLRVAMVKDYAYDQVKYFHKDHLGSSSVVTDADGEAREQTRYMPFGGKRGDGAGITASNYLFTDQELDKESGLYNYDARLYDPIIGRFVSADTVVPGKYKSQAHDRYAYVLNNPLVYVDPTGHHNERDGYGPDMGGFEGLGIGNPGSYGGSNDPTSDSSANSGNSSTSSQIGYGWGYWGAGVISEHQYGSIVTQVEISVKGVTTFRAIDISKGVLSERSSIEQVFSPNAPAPIDYSKLTAEEREEIAKNNAKTIGIAFGTPLGLLALAAYGPELATLSLTTNPNCVNDFVSTIEPGPPNNYSVCGMCGYAFGNVFDHLTK
jgi:RHS repeat-associated protein